MAVYALAERLKMTRSRLLDEADSPELSGWMAYDKVRPPTPVEFLLASICVLLAQLGGNKRAKIANYLPWLRLRKGKGGSAIMFRGARRREG